jgi:hypothetical protein
MNLSNRPEATVPASFAGMGIRSTNLDQSSSTVRMYFLQLWEFLSSAWWDLE